MIITIVERLPKLYDIHVGGREYTCDGNKKTIKKLCELLGYEDIFDLFKLKLNNSMEEIIENLLTD